MSICGKCDGWKINTNNWPDSEKCDCKKSGDGEPFKSPREIVSQGGRMKDTKPPKVHPTSRQGRGGDSQRSSAVNRYYAFKDSSNAFWEVMSSLDRLNIAYEYYGEDDTWSVLEIQGFAYSPPHRRTYEAALDYAKEGDRY